VKKIQSLLLALMALAVLFTAACAKKEEAQKTPAAENTPAQRVLSTPAPTRAPASLGFSALDDRIPPETIVLVSLRNGKKFIEDCKTTALYDAWKDPAVVQWYQGLKKESPSADQADLGSLADSLPEEMQKDTVLGILFPDQAQPLEKDLPVFLMTDQRGREEAHRAFQRDKFLAAMKKINPIVTQDEETIQGIKVSIVNMPNRPSLFWFEKDGIFVYTGSRVALEKLLSQAQTPNPAFCSSPAYQKALAQSKGSEPLKAFVDLSRILSKVQERTAGAAQKDMQILQALGLDQAQYILASYKVEDKGIRSTSLVGFSGSRLGLFDVFGPPSSPFLLQCLPEEALYAGEMILKPGTQLWQDFLSAVQKCVAPDMFLNFQKSLTQMQQTLGVNIADDLFSPLNGRVGYAFWGALPMAPNVLFVVGCNDAPRLVQAIGKLAASIGAQNIGQSSYKGVSYSYFSLSGTPYQISYVTIGGIVGISNQMAGIQRVIDIYVDKKGSLAASPKFARHAQKLPQQAVILSYDELDKAVASMAGLFLMQANMQSQAGWLKNFPDLNSLTKYFFGNSAAVTTGPDSLRIESFATSLNAVVITGMMAGVALPGMMEAESRSKVSRARSDMRSMATALESYYVDNNAYAAWAEGDLGVNSFLPQGSPARNMPTFRRYTPGGPMTLTTPIAYINGYLKDPFAPEQGQVAYSYYSTKSGWILISPGPDRDYDIIPQKEYQDNVNMGTIPPGILDKTYDPTNGTISNGDIYRIKM